MQVSYNEKHVLRRLFLKISLTAEHTDVDNVDGCGITDCGRSDSGRTDCGRRNLGVLITPAIEKLSLEKIPWILMTHFRNI